MGNPTEVITDRVRLGLRLTCVQERREIFSAIISGKELNCDWITTQDLDMFKAIVEQYVKGLAWNRGRDALCGIMIGRGFTLEPSIGSIFKVTGWLDLLDPNRGEALEKIIRVATKTMTVAKPVAPEFLSVRLQEFIAAHPI